MPTMDLPTMFEDNVGQNHHAVALDQIIIENSREEPTEYEIMNTKSFDEQAKEI
jgi:hypothetical protein